MSSRELVECGQLKLLRLLGFDLCEQPLFLLAQFGREFSAEVGRLKHLADFENRFFACFKVLRNVQVNNYFWS